MSVYIIYPPAEPCIDCGKLRDPAVERCPECWCAHMTERFLSDLRDGLREAFKEATDAVEGIDP